MRKLLSLLALLGSLFIGSAEATPISIIPLPYLDFNAQFGGKPDGATDNSPALQSYVDYVCANFPPLKASHITQTPSLVLSAGTYYFSSTVQMVCASGASAGLSGMKIVGQGQAATVLQWNGGAAPFLAWGTFNASAPSYYIGNANVQIEDLQFYDPQNVTPGTRTGIAMQDNGFGGMYLKNVKFFGFQYGFEATYGSDFDTFTNVGWEGNDVGAYFGPGSQQLIITGGGEFATFYNDREGLVLAGVGNFDCFGCWFVNDGVIGEADHSGEMVAIENYNVGSTDRIGLTILSSPNEIDSPKNFWGGWYETNAGGLGWEPLFWFRFTGNYSADAIRTLNIFSPYIVSGSNSGTLAGSAFVGYSGTGGVAPRNIVLENANGGGGILASWFNGTAGAKYRDLHLANPATLNNQPLGDATAINFTDLSSYVLGAEPSTGYWARGTLVRSAILGLSAGKVCYGWVRLTDGTHTQSNTDGTDWSQVCSSSS